VRTEDMATMLAVRDTGNFSRAAQSLGISQPAVSLAVRRVEEEFGVTVFDRSGPQVAVLPDGRNVLLGIERILETLDGLHRRAGSEPILRVGLSPLLSGRDAARLVEALASRSDRKVVVDFVDSAEIASRAELDVCISLPSMRRTAGSGASIPTRWIGSSNGVFIRSRQEQMVWDRAAHVLLDHHVPVVRIIEVNDCGQAYHLAAGGAGFTPCVMTPGIGFSQHVVDLPPLPPTRLDVFARDGLASMLSALLEGGGTAGGATTGPQGPAATIPVGPDP
jgi:hypothetical protein